MKRFLLTILFTLFLIVSAFGNEFFKYKSVVGCGPKIIMSLDDVSNYESWKYYLIHVAESGHIVIYNNGYQYATFAKKNYDQLWNQNHRVTSLKLSEDKVTNTYQFELISEFEEPNNDKDKKLINYFNLNIESMTFAYRRVGYPSEIKYEPTTGICWKII